MSPKQHVTSVVVVCFSSVDYKSTKLHDAQDAGVAISRQSGLLEGSATVKLDHKVIFP